MINTTRVAELENAYSYLLQRAEMGTGIDLARDVIADTRAALAELLAYCGGYDPQERLPENTCDVVVDVVIMDSPSGEIIEHQLGYWFEGKWRTFDSDGAEAVLSDGYRVTRWYPLPGGER